MNISNIIASNIMCKALDSSQTVVRNKNMENPSFSGAYILRGETKFHNFLQAFLL